MLVGRKRGLYPQVYTKIDWVVKDNLHDDLKQK